MIQHKFIDISTKRVKIRESHDWKTDMELRLLLGVGWCSAGNSGASAWTESSFCLPGSGCPLVEWCKPEVPPWSFSLLRVGTPQGPQWAIITETNRIRNKSKRPKFLAFQPLWPKSCSHPSIRDQRSVCSSVCKSEEHDGCGSWVEAKH